MSKKKHTETPTVDPTAEQSTADAIGRGNTSEDHVESGLKADPILQENPPDTPKRHKRTKAEMEAARETERLARMNPLEAIAEGRKSHDATVAAAFANVELAETTLREAKDAREKFLTEAQVKVDEFIAQAKAALGD